MNFVTIEMNGSRTNTPIPMTACDVNFFLDQDSLKDYTEKEIYTIKNKAKYYLCPINNFTVPFVPYYFPGRQIFLQINFDFKNTSILSDVENQINQKRPRLNFPFKNIFIDSENKSHPYYAFIDQFYSEIDYKTAKKIDLSLNPYEIHDDDNIFGSVKFTPINTKKSSQKNSTIFQTSIKSSQFGIFENRTQNLYFNNNKPFLNFFKIRIQLNPALKITYRSYKKFATFLADVTSILSNLLMICAIIMIRYNSIQGKNNMIMSMFSHKSIKNLKSFKDDFKPIFEGRNKYIQIHQKKKINELVRVSAIDFSVNPSIIEESNLSFIFR